MRPLDIIVPIYRNAGLLKACVDSLLAHRGELPVPSSRLLLINDSPGDLAVAGLLDAYAANTADLVVLHNEANLGFVQTVNRGLRLATEAGHAVLLVNADTVTFAGTLAQLMLAAHADPCIGFASPRSNNASLCSWPHQQDTLQHTAQAAYLRWATLGRSLPAFHFAPTAVGFYMYIAYAVVADFGPLRDDFGVGYEEENDLVMRAGKVGYRAVLANHAFAYHAGAASFALTGMDLAAQRKNNLDKLVGLHPEFLPLMTRYERSAHFRAERLLAGLLPDGSGRTRLVFDWAAVSPQDTAAPFPPVAALAALARRHERHLQVAVVCSERSFEALGLNALPQIVRDEPGASGVHGIAVRTASRLEIADIERMESLAPVQIYVVCDSSEEDCGPVAAASGAGTLREHIGAHANGLVFVSQFGCDSFHARHPQSRDLPLLARLLPTRLSAPASPAARAAAGPVVILGSGALHDGTEAAARRLSAAFATIRFIAVGAASTEAANLACVAPQGLAESRLKTLLADAHVVVLPSYAEGFNHHLLQALSARRPVVVRRTPSTEQILGTLDDIAGVYLFDVDAGLAAACAQALAHDSSVASDRRSDCWDSWLDAFACFCREQAADPRVFERLVARTAAADRLLQASSGPPADSGVPGQAGDADTHAASAAATDLNSLLALQGRDFVAHAYATLLCRPADNAGIEFYAGQLRDGTDKLDVLRSLSISPEGRARGVTLPGLDAKLAARGSLVARIVNRVFGR